MSPAASISTCSTCVPRSNTSHAARYVCCLTPGSDVQSAKARPEIVDLLRHPFSGWSESEEGSASSARSADTSAAMDTDAPQQQHKQRPQQQQAVEQPPSQLLGQPGFPTPFGNNSLQVRCIRYPGCLPSQSSYGANGPTHLAQRVICRQPRLR